MHLHIDLNALYSIQGVIYGIYASLLQIVYNICEQTAILGTIFTNKKRIPHILQPHCNPFVSESSTSVLEYMVCL